MAQLTDLRASYFLSFYDSGTDDTIIGTAANDIIMVHNGFDIVWAGDGQDSIFDYGDSNDEIHGETENDTIFAGRGVNFYDGGSGLDTVDYSNASRWAWVDLALQRGQGDGLDTLVYIENARGSNFDDWLAGSTVVNILSGGDGHDKLFGYGGADSLYGGSGDDVLTGGTGSDRLDGGADYDVASYASAMTGVRADLSVPGTNTGDAAGDTYFGIEALEGSNFSDTLVGDDGLNVLWGNDGADRLLGGGRADILIGGAGADTLDGGSGFDTASYRSATAAVTVDTTRPGYSTGEAAGDTFISIERFDLTDFADRFTGGTADEAAYGHGGRDVMTGGGGRDTLDGGDDWDVLKGGDDDDVIFGGSGSDAIYGDAGNDTLTGGAERDYFTFNVAVWGRDTITDFQDTIDLIDLRGSSAHSISDLRVTAGSSGIGTLVTFGTDAIEIPTVRPADISVADFLFA